MKIKEQIRYLVTLIMIFIALGYFKHKYFYIVSSIFSISLISEKTRLIAINKWQKLGFILQKIISPIVLGALYFLVLTPISILKNLFSKTDPLVKNKPQFTNFHNSEMENDIEDFEKLW